MSDRRVLVLVVRVVLLILRGEIAVGQQQLISELDAWYKANKDIEDRD